ncbi:unnamed protein product [Trichogramma brassicae]|uniref:Uncharacterized protein n=1 Tax=Trichogramma brassicae TaxID=86971 RepID=A0A6H5IXP4_9HYME|nr:unnamed protein product [Trichogramma brassicae]
MESREIDSKGFELHSRILGISIKYSRVVKKLCTINKSIMPRDKSSLSASLLYYVCVRLCTFTHMQLSMQIEADLPEEKVDIEVTSTAEINNKSNNLSDISSENSMEESDDSGEERLDKIHKVTNINFPCGREIEFYNLAREAGGAEG